MLPPIYLTTGDTLMEYRAATGHFQAVATVPGATAGSFSDSVTLGPDGSIYTQGQGGIWRWSIEAGSAEEIVTFGSEVTVSPGGFAFGPAGRIYVTAGDSLLQYDAVGGGFQGVVATVPGATVGSFSDGVTAGPDGAIYSQGQSGIWRWDVATGSAAPIVTFGSEVTVSPGGFAFGLAGRIYVTAGDSLLQYDAVGGGFQGVVTTVPGATVGSFSDSVTAGPAGLIYTQSQTGIWRWNTATGSAVQVVTFGSEITSAPGGFVIRPNPSGP